MSMIINEIDSVPASRPERPGSSAGETRPDGGQRPARPAVIPSLNDIGDALRRYRIRMARIRAH